jgi:hypothetical protein
MTTTQTLQPPANGSLVSAILAGGLLAGTFDAISAFLTFGWKMTYGIASGVLGANAFAAAKTGNAAIWVLGLALHYLIALSAAAIYCGASRRLTFLRTHFLFGAVCCGIGVFLVMNLIVLPLSAVPFAVGPFAVEGMRKGLGIHIVLIGLPIATSLWFFSRRKAQ